MKKRGIAISVIAGSILMGVVGFSGCGGGGGGSSDTNNDKTNFSGVSVDGYIKGATVSLYGESTTTDANGKWTLSILTNKVTGSGIVTSTGGVDQATGLNFEGALKGIAEENKEVAVTPITTIAASLVEKGTPKDEAIKTVAEKIGVPPTQADVILEDPIKSLSDPAKAEHAQKVIKASLMVQKVAETFSKAVAGDADTKVVDAVYNAVAEKLADATSIEEVVTDPNTIADTVVENLVKNGVASEETKTVVAQKVEVAAQSAAKIAQTVAELDTTAISADSLDKTAKAIEVVTSVIEDKLTDVAKANDTTAIEEAKSQIETLTQTLVSNDTIKNIADKVTDTNNIDNIITTVQDTVDTALQNGETIDIGQAIENAINEQNSGSTNNDNNDNNNNNNNNNNGGGGGGGASVDYDKLKLVSVTVGDDIDNDHNKTTVNVGSNGVFDTITYKKFSSTNNSYGVLDLYKISFDIDNESGSQGFEEGETKTVALATVVEDKNTQSGASCKRVLMTTMTNVKLTYNSNGSFSVKVPTNAKLYGYAQKSDCSTMTTSKDNNSENGPVSTDTDGRMINYDFRSTVEKFVNSDQTGSTIESLKDYFTRTGDYTVSLYISGVDGVDKASAVDSSFVNTLNNNVNGADPFIAGKTFKISGEVVIQ